MNTADIKPKKIIGFVNLTSWLSWYRIQTRQQSAVVIKKRILATFGFNGYVPHSRSYTRCFAPCFWRSHCQPQSWCRFFTSELPFDYYLWGAVKDKCYVEKPEAIDALKDNILEAIGEIQLHTLKKLWNYFPLLTGKFVLSNKKRNLRKYSVVF